MKVNLRDLVWMVPKERRPAILKVITAEKRRDGKTGEGEDEDEDAK